MKSPPLIVLHLWAVAISACAWTREADPDMLKVIRDDAAEMQDRDANVKMLSKTKEGALAMIDMARKNDFPEELISSAALALAESDDVDVRKAAEKMLPLPKMKDGKQILPISKLVLMTGDAKAGREVFRSAKGPNCINCHLLEGVGREIGPPISTIGEKPKDVLYETILAPSASIQHGFEAWTIKTKDGKRLSGLKIEDNDEKFTLKSTEGEFVDIPVADIEKKIKEQKSLMPENLINAMTTKDLVDLVEYLSQQKAN